MNPTRQSSALLLAMAMTLVFSDAWSQRGRVIRPASTGVLDPNGDGYVSKTTSGFSNDGSYLDEFELSMFGIPKLDGDVAGDNIGKSCGITDLIPDNNGFSVYAVRDANNNLIFRFRVGDDNPSVEAWTILLDTDGSIGAADPDATAGNPGFEIDITLIKRNNSGVLVYDINGRDNCPSPVLFYDIDSHFQISIADEVSCGDPDYFYDFYVPMAEIGSAFGIDVNTGLRYVAVTNVSATCAMGGNISDISGVDNNDPEYSDCETCAFEALVNNQCPTPVVDLCESCAGFEKDKVSAPDIDEPIRAGQTVITGSTVESDIFIRLQVFTNIAPDGSAPAWGPTPREEKGVYAAGNLWSAALDNPLLDFDRIVAIAQKDEFTIPCAANDDNSSSTSVTVVAPNTPPVAVDQNINAVEDTPLAITLTGTDAENDVLQYSIVSMPANGTLTGNPPNLIYTPADDFAGADLFTFQVSDGIFDAVSPGTISIVVAPVNDTPVASNLNLVTPEDTPVATPLIVSDPDGDALVYTIIDPPINGTLSGTAPNLTYTPNTDYFGHDSFTFSANDGLVNSNEATVAITISPVDGDVPVAYAQNVATQEDTQLAITLTGSDPDLNVLTYIIVSPPGQGTLSGTAPNIVYHPKPNYTGPDVFTFRVNDGSQDSPVASVDITVTPVNDPPVAVSQNVPYDLNTPKAITLTGLDIDGDALTFAVVTQPANGSLSGVPPNITYTPDTDYAGSDSFTFTANDGAIDSPAGVITLNLNPVSNVPPVASDQVVSSPEDTPVSIMLSATDDNGDVLTYAITQPPSHGTLDGTGQNVTYTPDSDFDGADSFGFEASDGSTTSNVATVSITVTPINDAPVANSQSVTTDKNVQKLIVLTGSDIEGSALSFELVASPAHGALVLTDANATYTPTPGYTGADSFTFRVNDGELNSSAAFVSIVVNPTGSAPVASNTTVSTDEDMAVDIDLSVRVTDVDGDPITYSFIRQPEHGTFAVSGAILTYTPDEHYFGADTISFIGNDGTSDSNIGMIFLVVKPVNDLPLAGDLAIATEEDVPVEIGLIATDADGDPLTYIIVTAPLHGTLTGTAPSLIYTPDDDSDAADNFTFRVNDGTGNSNAGTVSITISPTNDAPVITELTALVPIKEDSTLRVCLNVTDVDGDDITFSDPVNAKGGGTMVRDVAPFDFCYIFTAAEHYNGESVWNFSVSDVEGLSGAASATIIILPDNDPPVALNDYATVAANGLLSFNVIANDLPIANPYQEFYDIYEADSADVLTITNIVTGPIHGSVTIEDDGQTLRYQPGSLVFTGADSVKYEVCDSGTPSLCDTAVLFIEVTDNDFAFRIYEGVSPNNDGLNDYLRIEGIHRYPENLVRIFDRFNNLVWEKPGYDNEGIRWEGKANNGLGGSKLPDGTYYYTVYLQENGQLYSGYVILKEN